MAGIDGDQLKSQSKNDIHAVAIGFTLLCLIGMIITMAILLVDALNMSRLYFFCSLTIIQVNAMIRIVFRLLLLTVLSSGTVHAGINDGLVEWLAQDATFTGVRQVEFHPVVNNTGKHFDFDAAAAATQTLRERLTQAGMVLISPGAPAPQQRIVIKSSLVYYQPGSVGGRWFGFGGGSAVCILRTLLLDGRSDRLLGDLTGAYQVQIGGLFTIGAEKKVPTAAAELLADRILNLVGLERADNEID